MSRLWWIGVGALLGAAGVVLAARATQDAPAELVDDEPEPLDQDAYTADATGRGFMAPQ